MKEIGGYFGLEQLPGKEYHQGLLKLNNGRNGLLYLIRARKIRTLLLPYFLCDSVLDLEKRCDCQFRFYHIGQDLLPALEEAAQGDTWLYVVNYYGQLSNDKVLALQKKYGNVILDNVQAFYQQPPQGVDTIYSCRKFFGVPDGGYLATTVRLETALPMDISKDRMKHVLGRFEGTASQYYGDFQENDEKFSTLEPMEMSALTQNILRAIDYEAVRRKRNENYGILENALSSKNKLSLTAPDGPYCYPFYCENGMQIKRQLAAERIYIPTLWPNVLQMDAAFERDLAENILPLPCDQRYDQEDMQRLLAALEEYL